MTYLNLSLSLKLSLSKQRTVPKSVIDPQTETNKENSGHKDQDKDERSN